MTEVNNHLFDTIDRQNSHESAHTRRTLVQDDRRRTGLDGAARPGVRATRSPRSRPARRNPAENITTVAATAEVLATIVNTVGAEKLGGRLDASPRGRRRRGDQEKNHYEVLTSRP